MGQWLQRLLGSAKYGAVSAATIQGYLRSASQIEEVWQQIEEKVDDLILQGLPPWESHVRMGYALAFVRASRMNVLFVQELLKADAVANAAGVGYLPKITYEQSLALCEHIEPYIEEALKASTNAQHRLVRYTLPLELGPHLRDEYQHLPLAHMQGIRGAAQEMREWSAGLLAKYELALHAAKLPLPEQVASHVEKMKGELTLGDFHLRTGVDMLGQLSLGQATDALNVKAEGLLWEAMESFYKLSQLVALSAAPARPVQTPPAPTRQASPATAPQQPRPIAPLPPKEDTSKLLNEVIAQPRPAAPAAPVEDVSKLLNEVIAQPRPTVPKPPTEDMSQLLDEVIAPSGASRDVPEPPAEDLLNQVANGPAAGQGGSAKAGTKGTHVAKPSQPVAEDTTLDLLADICGEQKDSN